MEDSIEKRKRTPRSRELIVILNNLQFDSGFHDCLKNVRRCSFIIGWILGAKNFTIDTDSRLSTKDLYFDQEREYPQGLFSLCFSLQITRLPLNILWNMKLIRRNINNT